MSRRSVASTPLSPDDLPDLPDIGEHSEDSSESVRAAAVTSSYSEICYSCEDDLNEDLLPGEIQDLDQVQDTTEEITRLVEQINRGDDDLDATIRPRRKPSPPLTGISVETSIRPQVPTSLPVEELKVLPSFDSAFGEATEAKEEPDDDEQGQKSGVFQVGDQTAYVAQDLSQRIKLASRSGSLATQTPSGALTPGEVSHLPGILQELEVDARKLAVSVQNMMDTLGSQLHNVTALTLDCMAAYENGVTRTCDAADANVKSMYKLLAKYEELGNAMQPVERISQEVKMVKQLLTQFESLVDVKHSKS